jgi:lipoprotein-anchoring transpeptidase ErfK/SrfK
MSTRHRVLASTLAAGALLALAGAGAAAAAAAPAPEALRVAAFSAPARVAHGSAAEVRGVVAPAESVTVTVQRLAAGGWRSVATIRTGADGVFRASVRLPGSASLRAVVRAGDGTMVAGPRRFVGVTRRVSLNVTAQRYAAIAGQPFQVRGTVVPAADGERVVLEGSVNGGGWRQLARPVVRAGRVAATVRPPRGGTWRFRLSAAPRPGVDAGGLSAARTMSVFAENPHGVPASASHYIVQALSEFRLYYYESGRLVRVFPVVFGKPSTPSPVGRFSVYSKTPGPGPAFGPYALWYHGNYGIHGTNEEFLLSRAWRYYSHGCTRNYNANIRWLYPRVPVGTPVINLR